MKSQAYTSAAMFATQPRVVRPPDSLKAGGASAAQKRIMRKSVSTPQSPLARSVTLPSRLADMLPFHACMQYRNTERDGEHRMSALHICRSVVEHGHSGLSMYANAAVCIMRDSICMNFGFLPLCGWQA